MGGKLEQYDVSAKEARLVEDRARLRAEFRKEFIKQFTNPHRHGEGGYLFDPQLQRWQSMKSQQWYYFKPTPKTLIYPLVVVVSCLGYGAFLQYRHNRREETYRKGLISYRDREFKFI